MAARSQSQSEAGGQVIAPRSRRIRFDPGPLGESEEGGLGVAAQYRSEAEGQGIAAHTRLEAGVQGMAAQSARGGVDAAPHGGHTRRPACVFKPSSQGQCSDLVTGVKRKRNPSQARFTKRKM